jgi:hypothetical protein
MGEAAGSILPMLADKVVCGGIVWVDRKGIPADT